MNPSSMPSGYSALRLHRLPDHDGQPQYEVLLGAGADAAPVRATREQAVDDAAEQLRRDPSCRWVILRAITLVEAPKVAPVCTEIEEQNP